MIESLLSLVFNVLIAVSLAGGLFFMFAGALGVARLPDFYSRSHAASKCVTLGISGLLLALVMHIGVGTTVPADESQAQLGQEATAEAGENEPVTAAATKAVIVIAFMVVAVPVGSHMLARAAHLAGVEKWNGTLSDDLETDRDASEDEFPTYKMRNEQR